MKVKAILKGNEIKFTQFVVFKKPEIEVEVDLPDEETQILSEDDIKKMPLSDLIEVIWTKAKVTGGALKYINRPYKELIIDALMEKYKLIYFSI